MGSAQSCAHAALSRAAVEAAMLLGRERYVAAVSQPAATAWRTSSVPRSPLPPMIRIFMAPYGRGTPVRLGHRPGSVSRII